MSASDAVGGSIDPELGKMRAEREDRLRSISKRGDHYLRSLFTTGALAVIRYVKIHGTKHRPWLTALLARRPTKVAAIALANKIARMGGRSWPRANATKNRRARGVNEIAPGIRCDVKAGRANSTYCRAGRSGDQDNPFGPEHCQMRAIDRDLIRGGHYGQRSCEPHQQAEHMAAPINAALVKITLANSERSTHGPSLQILRLDLRSTFGSCGSLLFQDQQGALPGMWLQGGTPTRRELATVLPCHPVQSEFRSWHNNTIKHGKLLRFAVDRSTSTLADVRYGAHFGPKSDIALLPRWAMNGHTSILV